MFWNNTKGHAYTHCNSFKLSLQFKSTLACKTEFHNLILSLIFFTNQLKILHEELSYFCIACPWGCGHRGNQAGIWMTRSSGCFKHLFRNFLSSWVFPSLAIYKRTESKVLSTWEHSNIFRFKHAYLKELQLCIAIDNIYKGFFSIVN